MDDLELQIGIENKYGVEFGDYFYFWYYGINVIFFVCRTTSYKACLYELAKRKIKRGNKTVEALCDGLKPTKAPVIITENNCWSKSNFWVDIKDKEHIYIPINEQMPIYKKALKMNPDIILPLGEFTAIKLSEEKENGILNYYWDLIK